MGGAARDRDVRLDPVERIVSGDGVRVAAYDFGGTGPDLVLAHATGLCAAVLFPLALALAGRFHCWALDLRAHGRSGAPPHGDFRWSGFSDDVASVVAGLGLERPLAFGHSCGGAAIVLAEEADPGTFAALYCYEPVIMPVGTAGRPLDDNPLSDRARRRRQTFPSAAAALANFRAKSPFDQFEPETLRLYVEEGFEPVSDEEGGDGRKVRLRCRREHEAAVYAHGPAHLAARDLGLVACPVRLACGEQADLFGPALLADHAARLRAASVEVLPGLGHFGPVQDPAAVAHSVVRAFHGSDTPEP